MKTKPVVIVVIAVIVIAACGFLFIRSKNLVSPKKGEITQFLNAFNAQIKAGNIDSASLYFEDKQKSKLVKVLLSVLTNKTNTGGKAKPIFKVSLNTEDALITVVNPEFATALVVTSFNHDNLPTEKSSLLFTIHKIDNKQYKITQVNATDFVKDYIAYQNKVVNKTIPEKDIYSPITLAAFKTAEQLKARYDSVVWFDHINNKTYYYVVKGKLPENFYYQDDRKINHDDFKIGLVNQELKEIIPAEYDLIHNINGTIEGLIEVEKADKRGLYNLDGKLVVPVDYDQIYPLKAGDNLAVVKNGENFFYLKADTTLSEKIVDFKIADIVSQIKTLGQSYTLTEESSKNVMEYNSRTQGTSLIIPPSYLTGLGIMPKFIDFPNPLRKIFSNEDEDGGEGSRSIAVAFDGDKNDGDVNWFQSAYYTIVNDYLGGRGGLYTSKNLLVVDKKHNQILGFNTAVDLGEGEGFGSLSGACMENFTRAINDSLFEFKSTSYFYQPLLNEEETLEEGPSYHYLQVKNGKLVDLKSERLFPTQFIKLDDSYLQGCYTIITGPYKSSKKTTMDHVNQSLLQYMKNEIYASYKYKFKNQKWNDVFEYRFSQGDTTRNANVDDSLTTIDKYNISFINNKLNRQKNNTLAAK
ncbi:WG repeat-containing protein [Mucilaginibacter sp.]|uniref:WG repeat-containing protein n=1 Tax=Mucilaginibacter sp. TaxID=1882438 RepID=UPI0025F5B139|nr:WG repeat-containing protein [Mucilaginibacter sp.]